MSVFLLHDGTEELRPFLSMLIIPHGNSAKSSSAHEIIIRWSGDGSGLDERAVRILNGSKYERPLSDRRTVRLLLQLYGIPCITPSSGFEEGSSSSLLIKQTGHIFIIPVFQMDALAIFHQEGDDAHSDLKRLTWSSNFIECYSKSALVEIGSDRITSLHRRLMRFAVRAVYAVGLDFACVAVQLQPTGSAIVIGLDTAPNLGEQFNRLYAKAINCFSQEWANKEQESNSAVMGMDPEFLLRNRQGKIVPASRYFGARGRAGYDSATVSGKNHIHPLVELRPEPSDDLVKLLNNLRRSMWIASTKITDSTLQWIAGGMPVPGLPLGGHLHFSGIWLNSALVRSMDNYMALSLVMIEDVSTGGRRRKYGRLGDVRRQSHGGFEYRTLPSWIISPRIAKGVLALAKLIVSRYRQLSARPLDRLDILQSYVEGNKIGLQPVVADLWSQMESVEGYGIYAKYLEPFKNAVMNRNVWNEQRDFRSAWRVPPFNDKT